MYYKRRHRQYGLHLADEYSILFYLIVYCVSGSFLFFLLGFLKG